MIESIKWHNGQLRLLDQRKLPHQSIYNTYENANAVAEAITQMVVRGAPAIGITAAYGMVLAAKNNNDSTHANLHQALATLAASRPTAVNLFWALEKCQQLINQNKPSDSLVEALEALAISIHQEDIEQNQLIAHFGADFVTAITPSKATVYTHCNTGALATGGVGTALGVINQLHENYNLAHVFAGETRPWLQGSRLTAWELQQQNIPFQLVPDSSSAYIMSKNKVDAIIVGADRIAANGDVANKIGTYSLAVLAQYHNIPFIVAAPASSFDLTISSGDAIAIEERPASEITQIQGIADASHTTSQITSRIAPENCPALNYAFDITPHRLIRAIITEHGVIESPSINSINALLT